MSTPPAAPATPKTTAVKREYVILEKSSDTLWAYLQVVRASTADGAIKTLIGATGSAGAAQLVAVPKRHWNPRTPEVETKTTIRLG